MTRSVDLQADVAEILLSEATIQAKVAELGARISADYAGSELTLVSVLKGALPFMADLMRAISIPVRIDLMEVSSYGGATETSGQVRILKDLDTDVREETDQGETQSHADFPAPPILEISFQSHSAILANGLA